MNLTDKLATAIRGLLSQAAVDGADKDDINPDVVLAAEEALGLYDRQKLKCNEQDGIVPDPEGDIPNADYLLAQSSYVRAHDVVLHLQLSPEQLTVTALPNSDVMGTPYWEQTVDFA